MMTLFVEGRTGVQVQTEQAHMKKVFERAGELARETGAFGEVSVEGDILRCDASLSPEPAHYALHLDDGKLFVGWYTLDRYLSQSIEAELMWTGDDLEDCIDEELVDQGWTRGSLGPLEHFRDEEKRYTFRSPVPISPTDMSEDDARDLVRCLLAYEAVFRELGDMKPDDED